MEAKKAELRQKIAEQKETKKALNQNMADVITNWTGKKNKDLEDFSEAFYEKHETVEEKALCRAVYAALGLTTNTVQQQSLERAVMKLEEAELQKLFQSDLYLELIGNMENFLETRSVGALKKKIAALEKEVGEVEAVHAEVVETLNSLKDRLAAAGDTTKFNETIKAHKEKTKRLQESEEKVEAKRQRLQMLSKKKEDFLQNLQKQQLKIENFQIVDNIAEQEQYFSQSGAGNSSNENLPRGK